jgi:hypothetical protein
MARIVYRDDRGRFTKRHAQKYIRPEVVDTVAGRLHFEPVGNYRRGIGRFEAWEVERRLTAKPPEPDEPIVLRSFKSTHASLRPAADRLAGYRFVDVEVWYRGEKIVSRSKIPLIGTDRKKYTRWTHRHANETAFDRVRLEIKRGLEEQGFAITSKAVRMERGDKRTRAYARDRYDAGTEARIVYLRSLFKRGMKPSERRSIEARIADAMREGTVERPGATTIKPKIIIRGYR